MKTEMLKLDSIDTSVASKVREKLNEQVVEDYRSAMLAEPPTTFPPVYVVREGRKNWLGDGLHRVAAARRAKLLAISATVVLGTRADAEVHAAGSNGEHGLRRSQVEKRHAVDLFLSDPDRAKLSDRQVAAACKVSQPFVGKVRIRRKGDNVITPAPAPQPDRPGGHSDGTTTIGHEDAFRLPSWLPPAGHQAVGCIEVEGKACVVVINPMVQHPEDDDIWFYLMILRLGVGPNGVVDGSIRGLRRDLLAHFLEDIHEIPGSKVSWRVRPCTDQPDSNEDSFEAALTWYEAPKRWSWPHLLYSNRAEWEEERRAYRRGVIAKAQSGPEVAG